MESDLPIVSSDLPIVSSVGLPVSHRWLVGAFPLNYCFCNAAGYVVYIVILVERRRRKKTLMTKRTPLKLTLQRIQRKRTRRHLLLCPWRITERFWGECFHDLCVRTGRVHNLCVRNARSYNLCGHVPVERMKFQDMCSLGFNHVLCIGRSRGTLRGITLLCFHNLCVHLHVQRMKS